MISRIRNESINPRVKEILCKIYEFQTSEHDPNIQEDKNNFTLKLYNDLIEALRYDFNLCENSIHNNQAQVVHNQMKIDLDRWKQKWLKVISGINDFDKAFDELLQIIQCGFHIVTIVFQQILVMIFLLLN